MKASDFAAVNLILSVFGIAANIINIIVFVKQGFIYNMNISLLSRSISDLGFLLANLTYFIFVNSLMINADLPFDPVESQYLTSVIAGGCFSSITCWISVFITAERCISIILPLRVKQIITPKRTTLIICIIYIYNISAIIPEIYNFHFGMKFDPARNKTVIGLIPSTPSEGRLVLTYFLVVLNSFVSFISLTIFTVILVTKLIQKSMWRQDTATGGNDHAKNLTRRDFRAARLIVLLSSIMIICFIPSDAIIVVMIFNPHFSLLGLQKEEFLAVCALALVFYSINSSVNIFLYYNMSSSYRQIFHKVFGNCLCRRSGQQSNDTAEVDEGKKSAQMANHRA